MRKFFPFGIVLSVTGICLRKNAKRNDIPLKFSPIIILSANSNIKKCLKIQVTLCEYIFHDHAVCYSVLSIGTASVLDAVISLLLLKIERSMEKLDK
jgi:hypothetical protein